MKKRPSAIPRNLHCAGNKSFYDSYNPQSHTLINRRNTTNCLHTPVNRNYLLSLLIISLNHLKSNCMVHTKKVKLAERWWFKLAMAQAVHLAPARKCQGGAASTGGRFIPSQGLQVRWHHSPAPGPALTSSLHSIWISKMIISYNSPFPVSTCLAVFDQSLLTALPASGAPEGTAAIPQFPRAVRHKSSDDEH